MKGTVPGPQRPAPAAKTATHSTKRTLEPDEPPVNPDNRITLALLEDTGRAQGYDPYNAAAVVRPTDPAKRKPPQG